MESALEVRELTRHFGAVRAVDGINITLQEGEIVGMIGSNGAGKTTLLNVITGYVRPSGGYVNFRGQDIIGMPPRAITRLGIARTFQIPQLFTALTVMEHALIALVSHERKGLRITSRLREHRRIEKATEKLKLLGLDQLANRPVGELPEGSRKLLDIALALILEPGILLMDEPTAGVSEKDKHTVMQTIISALKSQGTTGVFIEHDMDVIRNYSDRVLVLDHGRVIADAEVEQVLADPEVRKIVLA